MAEESLADLRIMFPDIDENDLNQIHGEVLQEVDASDADAAVRIMNRCVDRLLSLPRVRHLTAPKPNHPEAAPIPQPAAPIPHQAAPILAVSEAGQSSGSLESKTSLVELSCDDVASVLNGEDVDACGPSNTVKLARINACVSAVVQGSGPPARDNNNIQDALPVPLVQPATAPALPQPLPDFEPHPVQTGTKLIPYDTNPAQTSTMPVQAGTKTITEKVSSSTVQEHNPFNDVVDMFPKIDPDFIKILFHRFISPNVVIDHIMTMKPSDIPKRSVPPIQAPEAHVSVSCTSSSSMTTVSSPCIMQIGSQCQSSNANDLKSTFWKSWAEFDTVNFYDRAYCSRFPLSADYFSESVKILSSEFPMVSVISLRAAAKEYDHRYCITRRALNEGIGKFTEAEKIENLSSFRGKTILIDVPPTFPHGRQKVGLKLITPRRCAVITYSAEPLLAKELEWLRLKPVREKSLRDEERQRELTLKEARDNNSLFECPICYSENIFENMRSCLDGHLFCHDCLKNYADEAIHGQGRSVLCCMADNCDQIFSEEMLKISLTSAQLVKLTEKAQSEQLNIAGLDNLVRCSKCNFAAEVLTPISVNKVFSCPHCKKEVCRVCNADWDDEHIGKPCKELPSNEETRLRKEYEERMALAIIRECPKCKKEIVKDEGCNKMTCPCGATLCYICRAPMINYEHFCRHPMDPGKPCASCTKCLLWEKPEIKDKTNLETLEREAKRTALEAETLRKRKFEGDSGPSSSKRIAH